MSRSLLALLFAVSASAVTPEVHRDLFYTEAKDKLQSLDVYSPPEGKDHPVIVWIHGGGWSKGDKAAMQQKPQAFVDKGFVLVSVNYRLAPAVTVKDIMADLAKSVRWGVTIPPSIAAIQISSSSWATPPEPISPRCFAPTTATSKPPTCR